MKPRTMLVLLCAVVLMSCATTSKLSNVAFEFPPRWHVGGEGEGLAASPDPKFDLPLLNVQVCERVDPACAIPCDSKTIRANYFIFSAIGDHVEYTQTSRPDGSIDFGATGVIPEETGDVQVMAHVLCSSRGLVFVNLMSRTHLEGLSRDFERTLQSVRWRN